MINGYLFQPPFCNIIPANTFIVNGCHQILAQYYKFDSDSVILFSHGNAEDLHTVGPFAANMAKTLGMSVVAYDYCGYGYSNEKPSAECCNRSAEAVLKWLLLFYPSDKIYLYGRSLGGGPSTFLASRYKVGGLILQSCFTSVKDMAQSFLDRKHLGWLQPAIGLFVDFDQFPNKALMRFVNCKTLVMHGTRDQVVPVSQGKELTFNARVSTWFPPTDHNDIDLHRDYWAVLQDWLASDRLTQYV